MGRMHGVVFYMHRISVHAVQPMPRTRADAALRRTSARDLWAHGGGLLTESTAGPAHTRDATGTAHPPVPSAQQCSNSSQCQLRVPNARRSLALQRSQHTPPASASHLGAR
eukprot:3992496-Prymnesium_polylepis.3